MIWLWIALLSVIAALTFFDVWVTKRLVYAIQSKHIARLRLWRANERLNGKGHISACMAEDMLRGIGLWHRRYTGS